MLSMKLDIHTHTIASGHYTTDTITDLAKTAALKQLQLLGICEHGPAIPGSCNENYFRNLRFAPSERFGIRLLYGAEVNIISYDGKLDLSDSIMEHLDYCIVGMHTPCLKPGNITQNTDAYIQAMQNPYIKIIAHPDDVKYPVDYRTLVKTAIQNHVFLEINNSSLAPNGYRGNVKENNIQILNLCKEYGYPIVLSSDSHGRENVGNFCHALSLIEEVGFPTELILNQSVETFLSAIR